jgi:hypothetical protein
LSKLQRFKRPYSASAAEGKASRSLIDQWKAAGAPQLRTLEVSADYSPGLLRYRLIKHAYLHHFFRVFSWHYLPSFRKHETKCICRQKGFPIKLPILQNVDFVGATVCGHCAQDIVIEQKVIEEEIACPRWLMWIPVGATACRYCAQR